MFREFMVDILLLLSVTESSADSLIPRRIITRTQALIRIMNNTAGMNNDMGSYQPSVDQCRLNVINNDNLETV